MSNGHLVERTLSLVSHNPHSQIQADTTVQLTCYYSSVVYTIRCRSTEPTQKRSQMTSSAGLAH